MSSRKKWFIQRIGKRVYHVFDDCPCEICQEAYDNGLMITDKEDALYLYDLECNYNIDGVKIKHFDTIKERNEFEERSLELGANRISQN